MRKLTALLVLALAFLVVVAPTPATAHGPFGVGVIPPGHGHPGWGHPGYGYPGVGFYGSAYRFAPSFAFQTYAPALLPAVTLQAAPPMFSLPQQLPTYAAPAPAPTTTVTTTTSTATADPGYGAPLASAGYASPLSTGYASSGYAAVGTAVANGYTYTNGFNLFGVDVRGYDRFGAFRGVHHRPHNAAALELAAARTNLAAARATARIEQARADRARFNARRR